MHTPDSSGPAATCDVPLGVRVFVGVTRNSLMGHLGCESGPVQTRLGRLRRRNISEERLAGLRRLDLPARRGDEGLRIDSVAGDDSNGA